MDITKPSHLEVVALRMGGAGVLESHVLTNKITENHEFFRIMSDFRNQSYVVERQTAERLLEYYRHVLLSFCLRRHVVSVWAIHGACGLCINGAPLQSHLTSGKWFDRHDPVVRALREIEQSLEYKFACYLDGRNIN